LYRQSCSSSVPKGFIPNQDTDHIAVTTAGRAGPFVRQAGRNHNTVADKSSKHEPNASARVRESRQRRRTTTRLARTWASLVLHLKPRNELKQLANYIRMI